MSAGLDTVSTARSGAAVDERAGAVDDRIGVAVDERIDASSGEGAWRPQLEERSAQPTRSPQERDSPQLAVPAWWPIATTGAGWASVAIVTGFWAANGGAGQLLQMPEVFSSTGRLTGLISADLLLLQVLLMARIPVIERSHGHDGLVRAHRTLGFASFNLLLAHIVLITRASAGDRPLVSHFISLVAEAPGMLLAAAATAMFALVVLSCLRAARRRGQYETWHLLHLYAYLGVGLSLPHELATGGDFLASPLATTYWWGLYLVTVFALLRWRIAAPLLRTLRHRLVVDEVVRESPDVVSIHMSGRNLAALKAGAGQFFLWRFLAGRGWSRAHPYSLSAAPTGDRLRITVKDLGDDSGRLADVQPGTRVLIEGPFGRLHSGVRNRQKVTLIAAGIGISPLRALFEDLDASPGDLTLIYRARDETELVLAAELDTLAAEKGARVHYLTGPRRHSRRGGSWLPSSAGSVDDTSALHLLVPDIADHDVYLCGPDPWLDAMLRTLERAGVPAEQVHLERFTW